MRIINEPAHRFGTVSLAEVFGDTGEATAVVPPVQRRCAEGLGTAPEKPRRHAPARLLHALVTRAAAWRERRSTIGRLSTLSDRELADIGLSRGQIALVFNPEFARARARRTDGDLEERVLADLGLSRTLPRPTAGR